MILAIDTCLGAAAVAVIDGERVLASLSEPMMRGHQERLGVIAGQAMAQAGIPFSALTRIGVTIGPGSFTGLRVGLAFAKGLGVALDIPCVGVGSLAALAVSGGGGFTVAAVDARKDQLYVQIFDGPTALMASDVLPVETVAARMLELHGGQPVSIVGSGAPLLDGVIAGARLIALAAPDPVAVARLAAVGPLVPPRPLYLRPPYANMAAV
ncbi:MAG: tRNA threonylcarbamoyladenosine biosynthesis protein TsaB [Caulobacter sp.]|nr:tRNA threonylcarbamoyladenosine biosynthesis protein TsaB [Caulobacter sp.]